MNETDLTTAERRVVVLLSEGLTQGQIAKRLNLSINTVKKHLVRIGARWGMPSAAGIVGCAYRTGAIDASPAIDPSPAATISGYPTERSVEEWMAHPGWMDVLLDNMASLGAREDRRHRRSA